MSEFFISPGKTGYTKKVLENKQKKKKKAKKEKCCRIIKLAGSTILCVCGAAAAAVVAVSWDFITVYNNNISYGFINETSTRRLDCREGMNGRRDSDKYYCYIIYSTEETRLRLKRQIFYSYFATTFCEWKMLFTRTRIAVRSQNKTENRVGTVWFWCSDSQRNVWLEISWVVVVSGSRLFVITAYENNRSEWAQLFTNENRAVTA